MATVKPRKTQKHDPLVKVNWLYVFITLAYGSIVVLTPNFNSFDSNAPRFLSLAILNIIAFAILFYKKQNHPVFMSFFSSKIGIAYTLLIIISGLSFIKSINVAESVVSFSKMFTVFSSAWIISVLIQREKSALKYLAAAFALMLIYDSFMVFAQIQQYIKGEIGQLHLIKVGYSNKNILAASLFIKIPFALWLFHFQGKWLKVLGLIALWMGVLAVLFMSARAFYLGVLLLSFAFAVFLLIRYYQSKDILHIKSVVIYTFSIAFAFLVFSVVHNNLYPKQKIDVDRSFTGRLATISVEDGGGGRLQTWKETGIIIKENPLLGVGLGNWKIVILKHENSRRAAFVVMKYSHNDFMQTTAETGVIGGLSYIFLFVFIFLIFVKSLIDKKFQARLSHLFLAAYGMLTYSIDAMFNFPHDRPEVQSLFAIFIGIGVANSIYKSPTPLSIKESKIISENTLSKIILVFSALLIVVSVYILSLNLKSLKIQRSLAEEKARSTKVITSEYLLNNLPSIPSVNAVGTPIIVQIASMLIEESKFQDVIALLKDDNTNPYDSRREFYLAYAYMGLNNTDSALHYIQLAHKLKPRYYPYVQRYADVLTSHGEVNKAIDLHEVFLERNKYEKEAWLFSALLNYNTGNLPAAVYVLDSALVYFPNDTSIAKKHSEYAEKLYMPEYEKAFKFYQERNYREAVKYFKKSDKGFIKAGGHSVFPKFLMYWAVSHYYLNEYSDVRSILYRIIEEAPDNYQVNLILGNMAFAERKYGEAVNYYKKSLSADQPDFFQTYRNLGNSSKMLNQTDEAIDFYEKALIYGYDDRIINSLHDLWKQKGDIEKVEYYRRLMVKQSF